MKNKQAIELGGYFAGNFGDDYIQKIAVHYMPEFNFYVSQEEQVSKLLAEEDNVYLKAPSDIKNIPKLVVTGSGFMVNSRSALICELVWFLRKKHIADFCIGCNIEPFASKLREWLVARKLQKFKFLICRDKKSVSWIKKNCPKLEIGYMPDIMFSMPDEWITPKTHKGKLGISLMHIEGDSENNSYYRAMAYAADCWAESTGKNILLMAFNVGAENDLFACRCVRKLMKHKDKAEFVAHYGDEIIKAFADCEKIIGARFHSAVLAIKTNIDFYPIIYRDKMRNLMSDIGYPVKGSEIAEVDTEDMISFLKRGSIDYKFNKMYAEETVKGFESLKEHMQQSLW